MALTDLRYISATALSRRALMLYFLQPHLGPAGEARAARAILASGIDLDLARSAARQVMAGRL